MDSNHHSHVPVSETEGYQQIPGDMIETEYMDNGGAYVEEYDDGEEYIQLADGSIVTTSSQMSTGHVGDVQEPSYINENITLNTGQHQAQSSGPTVFAIRGSQADSGITSSAPRVQPQVFKYVDNSVTRPVGGAATGAHSAVSAKPIYHLVDPGTSAARPFGQFNSSTYAQSQVKRDYNVYADVQHSIERQPPPQKTKRKALAGQRKPCNCTKSMCLKLYCDCFANGEFCRDCNCKDCHNNLEYKEDRTRAIKQSLERNPNAFKPKIGVSKAGQTEVERLHQKGCHCKKSGCLKNYCECYEAKVPCTDRCKCKGCQNTEHDRANRYKDKLTNSALMNLANAATAVMPSTSEGRTTDGPYSDEDDDDSDNDEPDQADPRTRPWFYMTDEVVEAATLCMVAQAEEALSKNQPESDTVEQMERLVLREFGRCLDQIIKKSVS